MFQPNLTYEEALRFSRFDIHSVFSTVSNHPIELEDTRWPTAEHYFQARTLRSSAAIERVTVAATGMDAYKIGSPWYRRKIDGFKTIRRTLMTRALYIKVQMYEEVRQALLDSGDQVIAESSLYDHYWGIARDGRGENMLGHIWMDIRAKLVKDMQSGNGNGQD